MQFCYFRASLFVLKSPTNATTNQARKNPNARGFTIGLEIEKGHYHRHHAFRSKLSKENGYYHKPSSKSHASTTTRHYWPLPAINIGVPLFVNQGSGLCLLNRLLARNVNCRSSFVKKNRAELLSSFLSIFRMFSIEFSSKFTQQHAQILDVEAELISKIFQAQFFKLI